MRIVEFIAANKEAILAEAASYARTLRPLQHADDVQLRDHLPKILEAVVLDLEQLQSKSQARTKSRGESPHAPEDAETAAETHGRLRAKSGLRITELVAEYRALRSSVLSLWVDAGGASRSVDDVVRFNEAIDQAIAESVAYFHEETENLRDLFLGVLGHDLRGPLNAILLTSELISQMAKDSEISRPAKTLIKSGRRMAALLDTLLEYNKATLGGGLKIEHKRVDLQHECAAELEILNAAFPGKSLTLEAVGDVSGEFDASRLRELLANLVSNAVAYGDQGQIRVRLEDAQDNVRLSVSNTGVAIDSDELKTLFSPLKRGTQASTKSTNLGLGLFIVEQIALAHGGSIRCSSDLGTTTFELELPKKAARDG